MKHISIIVALFALVVTGKADFEAITGKKADTIRVSNPADAGGGTLREALSIAKNGAVILLAKDLVIKPHSGEYVIDKAIKIKAQGRGAIINAEGRHRVFRIVKGGAFYAEGLTIAGGYAPRGAGVYNEGGFFSARKCHFTKNHGYGNSGGAYSQDGATNGEIFETVFQGNTDATQGGAIYKGGSGSLLIVNTAIFNNTAPNGGGISARGGNLNLLNVTIAGNAAGGVGNGGGIFIATTVGTVTVRSTNAIIAHNTPLAGPDVAVEADNGPSIFNYQHSLVTTAISLVFGGVANDEGGNTNASPAFTNVAGNDFTLTALSAAVDAGSTTAYLAVTSGTLDVAGNPRIVGSTIDIGAYEFTPPISQAPAMSFWSSLVLGLGMFNLALLLMISGGSREKLAYIIKGMPVSRLVVLAVVSIVAMAGGSYAIEGTVLLQDVIGSMVAGTLLGNVIAVSLTRQPQKSPTA